MATLRVRYLTSRPGRSGHLPRWFWQPSTKLQGQGWRLQRVPANPDAYTDARQLKAAAVAAAHTLNDLLDAARAGGVAVVVPPPTLTRTLGDLVALYLGSDDFTRLAVTTQHGYRQCLGKLSSRHAVALRSINMVWVQAFKRELAATPAYGNSALRVLSVLLAFGRRLGWLTDNPAARPGRLATEDAGMIWPAGAVDVFVAAADELGLHSIGTAVLLNEWLAQRLGDILVMPRSVIRQGSLVFRQSKTGVAVTLPYAMVTRLEGRMLAELARHGRREAAGGTASSTIIACERTGLPYDSAAFRKAFARVRARAALACPTFEVDTLLPGRSQADPDAFLVRMADLTFMHLRHTGVTRMAEAGCDLAAIVAVSGHADATASSIIERYRVRTAKLARGAFQKRMNAESTVSPLRKMG